MINLARRNRLAYCTKNLYFQDGTIRFKKGKSYEIIDDTRKNTLTLISETGCGNSIAMEGWLKYFIVKRRVLIEKVNNKP